MDQHKQDARLKCREGLRVIRNQNPSLLEIIQIQRASVKERGSR